MKKLLALATFVLLMGMSVMVVHADIGVPVAQETRWVTAESLNVRWEPSMQSGIITQVYQFERVVVDRRYGSGYLAWYHMRLVCNFYNISGWVFGGFLGAVGDHVPLAPIRTPDQTTPVAPVAPVAPVTPTPIPTPATEESVMRVTASMLNVRWEPSMASGIITAIPQDSWVAVNPYDPERVSGDWFYIRLVGSERRVYGWVYSGFLSTW